MCKKRLSISRGKRGHPRCLGIQLMHEENFQIAGLNGSKREEVINGAHESLTKISHVTRESSAVATSMRRRLEDNVLIGSPFWRLPAGFATRREFPIGRLRYAPKVERQ